MQHSNIQQRIVALTALATQVFDWFEMQKTVERCCLCHTKAMRKRDKLFAPITSGIAGRSRKTLRQLKRSKLSDTLIIAHRGLSDGQAIENSLESFASAIELGIPAVELDVRRTVDGAIIVFHDNIIKGKAVGKLTHEQLTEKAGMRPPLFPEVLSLIGHKIIINVEIKESGYEKEIIEALRQYVDPRQTIVSSFLDDVIVNVKTLAPEFFTGLLTSQFNAESRLRSIPQTVFPMKRIKRCQADFLIVHSTSVKAGVLWQAENINVPVIVWTVNRKEGVERFLYDPRVYGIITDYPLKALDLLEQEVSQRKQQRQPLANLGRRKSKKTTNH